jgi:ribonuclease HII
MSPRNKFNPALIPEAPDLSYERDIWAKGIQFVAGIDEAGRGALAGPVSAGAVILPKDPGIAAQLHGLRDSKQLSPAERETWASRLNEAVLACGVGFASSQEIDALGIVPAVRVAIRRALDRLSVAPEHLLVDFLNLPELTTPQTALVKGDARVLSIAAASVLAKTARDAHMLELDLRYPGYGFAANKGYGTQMHRDAIQVLGPSPVHRASFHIHSNL